MNAPTEYKAMYKCELARAAGVSDETFRRWLMLDRSQLRQMGCKLKTKILNPAAVRFLCEKYCIDLE